VEDLILNDPRIVTGVPKMRAKTMRLDQTISRMWHVKGIFRRWILKEIDVVSIGYTIDQDKFIPQLLVAEKLLMESGDSLTCSGFPWTEYDP
jgi:hypothetical protein